MPPLSRETSWGNPMTLPRLHSPSLYHRGELSLGLDLKGFAHPGGPKFLDRVANHRFPPRPATQIHLNNVTSLQHQRFPRPNGA